MRLFNEGLAFLLELLALAALAYWGFRTGDGLAPKLVFGIGAPVLAAIVWGLFAAPRATFGLPLPGVLLAKAVVYGAAVVALIAAHQPALGIVLAVLAVANTAYVTVARGRNRRPSATPSDEPAS